MSSNPTLDRLQASVTVPSHTNAGVDGDTAHAGEGYHTFRRLLGYGDYSSGQHGQNVSPRDLGGRDNCSSAIDIGLDPAHMRAVTGRLIAATQTAAGRNLLRGLREFNGTVDSVNTLNRDAVLGWTQNYTPNLSHLAHVHLGFFRDACEDWAVIADVLAVINGTASGLTTQGGTAVPIEEDILAALSEDELKVLVQQQMIGVARSPEFKAILVSAILSTIPAFVNGVWGRLMKRDVPDAPALGGTNGSPAVNFLTAVLADTRAIRQKIGV